MAPVTPAETNSAQIDLSSGEIKNLTSARVFFGHKSVGANVLEGLKSLMAGDPRLKLKLVRSSQPASVRGPAFIEDEIGENGNAFSKNAAFRSALRTGLGPEGGIALYKYCYVDITESSNVAEIFEQYRRGIAALSAEHPNLRFIHVTTPLTTVEPAAKARIKAMLGRPSARQANARRNEFNDLMRQAYPSDSIFDLAKAESTHPDGSRSYFTADGKQICILAEEYTTDGGHLNALGSQVAAREMLKTLAKNLPKQGVL